MSKRTSIRIPDDLYRYLVDRANREQRTVSNLIVYLLTQSVHLAPDTAPEENTKRGVISDKPRPSG
jgi:hypothetical protein